MRTRLKDADSKIIQYLDTSDDEREYSKQEIATQLSLHNELYKMLARCILLAAIVGMQTRFQELKLLLFGFLRVVILLVTVAVTIAYLSGHGRYEKSNRMAYLCSVDSPRGRVLGRNADRYT